MNIYIKLTYTGAEEGVEFVECTELNLISLNYYDFCIFSFICFVPFMLRY